MWKIKKSHAFAEALFSSCLLQAKKSGAKAKVREFCGYDIKILAGRLDEYLFFEILMVIKLGFMTERIKTKDKKDSPFVYIWISTG